MRSPFLFLVLLTGCPNTADKIDDTGPGTDDTGDTDPNYATGCITVDGGGGYAKLADAVTVAPDGAVIELCDGTYEEAVTVDKPVTIRGSAGTGTFLEGGGVEIPLTITGTGVVLENLVVSSSRTGIEIGSGADVTLTNVTVAAAGSWGITSTNATVMISGLTVVEPAAGGLQVSGGAVTVTDASFEYPGAYGIDITDDAVVSLTNTTITGTVMLSDDISDGYAIQIDAGTLTMTGSTIAGADGMGIYANEADITLVDTTFTDAAFLAVFAFDSTFDFSGVNITGSLLQGIYAQGPSFSMTNSTVSTASDLSCSYLYEEWGQSGNPWCGGLLVAADTIDLSEVSISGYNNYGMLLQPNEADLATATVTGGTIDDVGRWGAYFAYVDGTISGLTVSNSREPEIADPCSGYINQSAGLLGEYSELAIDGATISGNAGWGMSQVLGSATVSNSTFDGNGCYTFVNYQSVGTLTGNTFTHGAANGGIYDSQGVLTIDGNTFLDNKAGVFQQYDYGDYIYTYEASGGQGQDVFAYTSGALTVTNNTFTGGDNSIAAYLGGAVVVTGNTWSDYEGTVFVASDLTEPAVFADNVVDDVAGGVVQASSSEVEVENVQVGATRASEPIEVTYTYDYPDDASDFGGSYTTSSSSYLFYVYGYYYDDGAGTITEEPGSLSVRDVTVGSSYSTLLYASNGSLDVSGLSVGTVGGSALYGYWDGFAPDVEIQGLSTGAVSGDAVSLYSYTRTDFGSVALSDVTIESATGDGLSATAIGEIVLTDVSFGEVYGNGVSTVARSYDYTYAYDESSGTYVYTYVDIDAGTEVAVDGLSFTSVAGDGLALQGGTASVAGFNPGSVGGDGIFAEGLSSLVVSVSAFASPGGSGVTSQDTYSFYSYEAGTTVNVDADTAATITGVTTTDASGAAYSFEGGSVALDNVTGTSAADSGLVLAGALARVVGSTFTGNGGYGMTCDESVTLSECATNDLSDNGLGTHDGCSDSCSE